MWKALSLAALVTGCGAQLAGDDVGQSGAAAGIATNNNGGSDAGNTGMMPDAPTPAACTNGRDVYLVFDGISLTQGSPSDATQNRVSWMTNATATIPPYRQNDADRLMSIQMITNGVKARLANTPIQVVTQRPASGPYVMVVFGGTSDIIGTIYSYATNEHDCGDGVKNDVGWVSDVPSVSYAQDLAVGAIGWGLGLNGTNDPTDCMCAWANECASVAGACTLSSSIASTTSLAPATTCPNQNPQNEVAAFSTGFCQ